MGEHPVFPKWIVEELEDGSLNFALANVSFHRKLKSKNSKVLGGGFYMIDNEKKTLMLYDKSVDFGPCTIEQVRKAKEEVFRQSLLEYEWLFSPAEYISQVETLYGGWETV